MFLVILIYTLLSVIVTSLLWWYMHLFKLKYFAKIPGPKPRPFIGNATDMGSNPYELLENLNKFSTIYGDIYKIFLGPNVRIVTTNANLIEQIVQSNVQIVKSDIYDLLKPWLNDGLLVSKGLKWKARRKLITPSFHFTILERFLQIFDKNANTLIEKLRGHVGEPSVDLLSFLSNYSLDVICETSMGQEMNSQNNANVGYVESVRQYLDISILRHFSSWKRFPTLFQFSKDYKPFSRALKILHDFSNRVIAAREETLSYDDNNIETKQEEDFGTKKKLSLLDMLLEQKINHNLTREDIREEVDTFIFEGHDTVTSGISFALYALANHPAIQQKLYEEITQELQHDNGQITSQQLNNLEYLDMVVKESLRMYPSVPFIERQLVEDFTFDNQIFPAGTAITFFLYGMHHANKHFPEPEQFDPERFSRENRLKRHKFAYLPFSAGPRNCIGQRYALNEMKSTIVKVLQNFELLPVPGFKLQLGVSATLQSYRGICVRIKLRAN